MNKINIAVMAGGDSSEREISLKGAVFIAENLNRERYVPYIVDIRGTSWSVLTDGKSFPVDKNDFSFTCDGKKTTFGFVVIVTHGAPGETGHLQGYLDMMGIPHSACGLLAAAATFDKRVCKTIAATSGVAMAKDLTVRKGEPVDTQAIVRELGLPLFIKPNEAGSSFGVSKVRTEAEIVPALEKAFSENPTALLESCITGTEVSCGIFAAGGKEYILPPTEIVSENDFFDYDAKYNGKSKEITPARVSDTVRRRLADAVSAIYKALKCKGVVRIDFIVQDEVPYMIELNSVPGMSLQSIIPQQVRAYGMSVEQMYDLIIEDALNRR